MNDVSGNAILEVIADSTYFEAWKSEFELKNKKSVGISEIKINSNDTNIVVENVNKVYKKQKKQSIQESKSIFISTCSSKNKELVKGMIDGFKLLKESEINSKIKELKSYKPSKVMEKWASSVFANPKSKYAKYCMLEIQKKL